MTSNSLFPKTCLILILLLFMGLSGTCQVMHPQGQIDFVKTQIKNQQAPYWEAYQELLAYADFALNSEHHALIDFNVPGFYVDPDAHQNNSKSLQTDAFNAYACALAYRLGRKKKYGKKAVYFLKVWADTNQSYSEADGPLVMAYSGPALMIAAELMQTSDLWKREDLAKFHGWVANVYRKACNEIRSRKNNWADWGRYGSVLSAAFLQDELEMKENIRSIKSDLFEKIAADGHMPEEVRRQDRGLWYTYFSLAPITAACWAVLQAEGTDLFHWEEDGQSLKSALDYLLRYVKAPESWPWHESQRPGDPDSWPGNLMEAMELIYHDPAYGDYVNGHQPISYPNHHFAWTFPTLMKAKLKY